MAVNEKWVFAGLAILALVMWQGNQAEVPTNNGNGNGNNLDIDFGAIVETEALFTGQRMFKQGTALTAEWVRILQKNGDGIEDLQYTSLDSGTQSTEPHQDYLLYYGENSSTYYTAKETYNAPAQDATDNKKAKLCTIDTSPTLTSFDEFGRPQAPGTNVQSLSVDDQKNLKVRVKVSADECYGNPNAPGDNAICFRYNSSKYDKVETTTGTQDIPYIVANKNASAGYSLSCYKLPKMIDTEEVDLTLNIEVASTYTAASGDNTSSISFCVDDIGFDLNADDLTEIWDFQDEDNNELGVTTLTACGMIYVS